MKTNRGLGRGLSALFSDTEEAYENASKPLSVGGEKVYPEDIKGLTEVDIDLIRPNPNQPRTRFRNEATDRTPPRLSQTKIRKLSVKFFSNSKFFSYLRPP